MPNQIIDCPRSLIGELVQRNQTPAYAEGPRVQLHALSCGQGFDTICVKVRDRRLHTLPTQPLGTTFVLMLTASTKRDPNYQPMPLPDDLVLEMIDALQDAILELKGLSGHDQLALWEILDRARQAQNESPIRHRSRVPANEYEKRIRTDAEALDAFLGGELRILDKQLTACRSDALRSGTAATIKSLSMEGAVIDLLQLKPATVPNRFTLNLDNTAKQKLFEALRQAQADRETLDHISMGTACYAFGNQACTSGQRLIDLYRGTDTRAAWRRDQLLWRGIAHFPDPDLPEPVPAERLWWLLSLFHAAFDRELLAEFHAVVRCTLAIREFAHIAPLPERNSDTAKLLFSAFMEELTCAPLLMPLLVHRRRVAISSALKAAVHNGDIEALGRVAIDLLRDSLAATNFALDWLRPARSSLLQCLHSLEPDRALAITDALLGKILLGPDDAASRGNLDRSSRRYLKTHFDKVRSGPARWSSSPVIRSLMASLNDLAA